MRGRHPSPQPYGAIYSYAVIGLMNPFVATGIANIEHNSTIDRLLDWYRSDMPSGKGVSLRLRYCVPDRDVAERVIEYLQNSQGEVPPEFEEVERRIKKADRKSYELIYPNHEIAVAQAVLASQEESS